MIQCVDRGTVGRDVDATIVDVRLVFQTGLQCNLGRGKLTCSISGGGFMTRALLVGEQGRDSRMCLALPDCWVVCLNFGTKFL